MQFTLDNIYEDEYFTLKVEFADGRSKIITIINCRYCDQLITLVTLRVELFFFVF